MTEADVDTVSKDRLRLWLRLLKSSRIIETEVRARLKREFDTTLPRFDVMATLLNQPDGMNMSELSGALRVSNGNVTGIVDRLVAEELVERISVKGDRRVLKVRLTAKGEEVFGQHARVHEAWIDDLLSSFSSKEASKVSARLDKLIQTLTHED